MRNVNPTSEALRVELSSGRTSLGMLPKLAEEDRRLEDEDAFGIAKAQMGVDECKTAGEVLVD